MDKEKVPALIGAAQFTDREKTNQQIDPLLMMAEVSMMAAKDAKLKNIKEIDTLYIVNCLSRIQKNPGKELAEILGIEPSETGYTAVGGSLPQWLANLSAERIYRGKSRSVLICGAESYYTEGEVSKFGNSLEYYVSDYRKSGKKYLGDIRRPYSELEVCYQLVLPVFIYAMFENALRAHWKKSIGEHMTELSSYCANLSEIASNNPFAWSQESMSPHDIKTVSENNQMVVFPYTKRMCANMMVNQAAAVIMTSLARAEALGIPKDRIIFLRGSGDAEDNFIVSERPQLWATPSVIEAANLALNPIPLSLNEVEFLDFYTCFPCVPRILREMFNMSDRDPRPLSVTGGLPYFGGPGNNYSLHAITTMIDILRENNRSFGLIHAISWFLSKHSIGIYSADPGMIQWRPNDSPKKAIPYPKVNVVERVYGKGIIETYNVTYTGDGEPNGATIIGRDEDGNRFIARVRPDKGVLVQMTMEEMIGKTGNVKYDQITSVNWFSM